MKWGKEEDTCWQVGLTWNGTPYLTIRDVDTEVNVAKRSRANLSQQPVFATHDKFILCHWHRQLHRHIALAFPISVLPPLEPTADSATGSRRNQTWFKVLSVPDRTYTPFTGKLNDADSFQSRNNLKIFFDEIRLGNSSQKSLSSGTTKPH